MLSRIGSSASLAPSDTGDRDNGRKGNEYSVVVSSVQNLVQITIDKEEYQKIQQGLDGEMEIEIAAFHMTASEQFIQDIATKRANYYIAQNKNFVESFKIAVAIEGTQGNFDQEGKRTEVCGWLDIVSHFTFGKESVGNLSNYYVYSLVNRCGQLSTTSVKQKFKLAFLILDEENKIIGTPTFLQQYTLNLYVE